MASAFCIGLLLATSCVDPSEDRTTTVAANDIGVTTLSTTRLIDETGNRVFALHAYAGAREVGSLELTTGSLQELSTLPGSGDHGSVLVIWNGTVTTHSLSREMRHFALTPSMIRDAKFLGIAEAIQLLGEQDIAMPTRAPDGEAAYWHGVDVCAQQFLLTTPVAQQCCYEHGDPDNYFVGTKFFRASDNNAVSRAQNPYGTGCKDWDGVSDCDGASCYFGPFGYARAWFAAPSYGTYPRMAESAWQAEDGSYVSACTPTWDPTPPSYYGFSDVSGTNPPGVGCPGGASGEGEFDY